MGSPYLPSSCTRHQQAYTTLTLKRHDANLRFEPSRKIYDDIDKLSTNENLRDFIQVLDSFAQEKFGGTEMNSHRFEQDSTVASSPTETNASMTLDSGYQSTKQLASSNDEYAVVMKTKRAGYGIHQQRRRSYSSIDDSNEPFRTEKSY